MNFSYTILQTYSLLRANRNEYCDLLMKSDVNASTKYLYYQTILSIRILHNFLFGNCQLPSIMLHASN